MAAHVGEFSNTRFGEFKAATHNRGEEQQSVHDITSSDHHTVASVLDDLHGWHELSSGQTTTGCFCAYAMTAIRHWCDGNLHLHHMVGDPRRLKARDEALGSLIPSFRFVPRHA